jgi:hypothetical protein
MICPLLGAEVGTYNNHEIVIIIDPGISMRINVAQCLSDHCGLNPDSNKRVSLDDAEIATSMKKIVSRINGCPVEL